MTYSSFASECYTEDERITAWDRIARHPFFNATFDDSPRPLIDSMIELLDKAVSLPSKGENMSNLDFTSQEDFGRDRLYAVEFFSNRHEYKNAVQFIASGDGDSVVLTLKDVAALHKALGDHLEAHKREFPREGAVRFPGGQIAVYRDDILGWSVTGYERAWGNPKEIERNFGADWEELVVKDA